MTGRQTACEIVPFPQPKQQAIDWLELNRRRHMMYALLEVDITEARHAIRAYRARTAAPLSLTAFLIHCLAHAVDEDRAMQAYRLGRRLVLFADVDVGSMVERKVEGARLAVPQLIRAANRKSLGQIEQELHRAQAATPEAVAAGSLPRPLRPLLVRGLTVWLRLPAVLRRGLWTWALHNPYRRKRLVGTVGVTAMSMFGHGTGWGIAPMGHTLTLIVGGLVRKPGVVGTSIAVREYLCLTLVLDHDVVDGAPAARFAKRLTELIESGAGLEPQAKRADPGGAHSR
jgi:pyruvate/2-oxoglutarate dehydrogenase complex dihydrolipoamide acyltransferase (E2) component